MADWIEAYLAYAEAHLVARREHALAKAIYPTPWGHHVWQFRAIDYARDGIRALERVG